MDELRGYVFEFGKSEPNFAFESFLSHLPGVFVLALGKYLIAISGSDVLAALENCQPNDHFRYLEFPAAGALLGLPLPWDEMKARIHGLSAGAPAFDWQHSCRVNLPDQTVLAFRKRFLRALDSISEAPTGRGAASWQAPGLSQAKEDAQRIDDLRARAKLERLGRDIKIDGRQPTEEERDRMKLNRKLA